MREDMVAITDEVTTMTTVRRHFHDKSVDTYRTPRPKSPDSGKIFKNEIRMAFSPD